MGRGKFRGKNRRGGRGGGGGGDSRDGQRGYAAITKENRIFQDYYDNLLQLPEEEREQFWDALKRELPNSFRFCGSKGHALSVRELLETRYIPEIKKIEHYDGKPVEAPQVVPWYPDGLAYWMTTPKNVVRRFPPFAAFQKFLVSETNVGNISRQEVVSMIPPLLMDIKPGHVVLDMCAAPGSKAAQLLEMVMQGEEARVKKVLRAHAQEDGLDLGQETKEEAEADLDADPSDDGRATGLLIANDADYKRSHMLVHQLKRLSAPNLLVSNHDATQFPSIKLPSKDPNSTRTTYLKFDRILADVPCSGDGTLRKNVNLWRDWQPGSALGLHATQIRILVRALQLLKSGGRVVYSTCSMNPIENEAIVVSAIERCGGPECVEIVDCSDQLTQLKRKPGLKKWNVMDKSNRVWNSWAEVEKFAETENGGVVPARMTPTMSPRNQGTQCEELPLERCMRVYSHMQDTGGFFITVLQKKVDFKAKPEHEAILVATNTNGSPGKIEIEADDDNATESGAANVKQPSASNGQEAVIGDGETATADKASDAQSNGNKRAHEEDGTEEQPAKKAKIDEKKTEEEADVAQAAPPAKKLRNAGAFEEPFKYLDSSHQTIQDVKQFYSLSKRFPDDRYMVRNEMGEPLKAIYYTTALTRDILKENEGRGVKFIHGGVKMFMKQDAPSAEVCRWRIQAEGMPILQGYVGEPRIVRLTKKETFRKLLIEMFPRISGMSYVRFDEIGERVRDITMGCCVLRVEPDGSEPDFTEKMTLPLWKSIHSLNLMLPKEDRSAVLLRVFNDSSALIHMNPSNKPAATADSTPAEGVVEETAVDVEDIPTPEAMEEDQKAEPAAAETASTEAEAA